jgi:hypothetical protein
LKESRAEQEFHVVSIRRRPFEARVVEGTELEQVMSDGTIDYLAITLHTPALSAATSFEFMTQNPDALSLHIGRETSRGLEESGLSTRTSNVDALAAWQRIARRFRAATRAGAVAVNPQTGESARIRSHRSTAGARELQRQGIPMLPVAGTALYTFPEQ